jgi:hypothetical protein
MSSRPYRLRLHGLDSPSGTIRARERHEVLSALLARAFALSTAVLDTRDACLGSVPASSHPSSSDRGLPLTPFRSAWAERV